MKKDEKIEKENTAKSISEEKNSPESRKKEEREQSNLRSSNNDSESAPENLPKKNHKFVWISGKQILFTFFLMLVIVAAGLVYVYRDQVKTILPNALVEYVSGRSQITKIDTQESIQNEMRIDEIEKQGINSDVSEPSMEDPAPDQNDFSSIDRNETGSSLRSVEEAQLVSKHEKLEDDQILHSEKASNEGVHPDISEDHEKALKVGDADILPIVKELHKITVEIEGIDFTKNLTVEDNPILSADHSNDGALLDRLLESLKGLIQIRKIKDHEGSSLSQEREKSLKNQFVINLISGKTMLIAGLNAEALDDIRRARKILNLIYDTDEENVPMMIGRLDKIIYQVEEMD